MKLLITGFDPFGNEKINPAWEAVKLLPSKIEGVEVIKLQIPTVFKESINKVLDGIKEYKPDVVLCVGQAGGRYDITVERVAINLDDARIKDNKGNQPIDELVYPDGKNAYFATLPIKAMVEEIKKNNIPASISNTAGTFVCNHVMYGLLYNIEKSSLVKKGGFIHVPFILEQVLDKKDTPAMDLNTVVRGLEAAIKGLYENDQDKKVTGGKEF